MKKVQSRYLFLLLLGLLSSLLASLNFRYGNFEDVDVFEILNRALKFPVEGYGPSRSWGFPLYEFFLYPAVSYFGFTAAKLQSAVFYILSGLLFFELVFYLTRNRVTAFLGSCCFLVHPISIITSSAIAATSQEVFFALAALYFFFRYFNENKPGFLYSLVFFGGLATATRQDYFVLGCGMAVTLLFFRKLKFGSFLLALAIYLTVTLGLYVLFYGANHFAHLDFGFLQNDPFLRKVVRGFLGFAAIFGLPTLLITFFYFFKRRVGFKKWREGVATTPAAFLFVSSFLLYGIRYFMNADKLEYVWIVFPLFVILSCVTLKKRSRLALLLLAAALPNILQIHFFRREGGKIKMDIGFSPGAVVQSRSDRLRNEYRFYGTYEETVARVAKEKFGCQNHFWYLADPPAPDHCIVVPEEMLRFWSAEQRRGKKIIVFDFPDNRGWRQFIRFAPWKRLDPKNFRVYGENTP